MNYMNIARNIAPHAVIAIGLCIGCWLLLVQPKLEVLAHAQAAEQSDAAALTPEQLARLSDRVKGLDAWTAEVQSLNAISRDSNRLFNIIADLAEANNVQITSLQPGRATRTGTRAAKRGEADVMESTRLDITATGQYEDIAGFIDAVGSYSTFIRPHSLQLSPTDSGSSPTVTARITWDVLSFNIPPFLAQRTGGEDVQ